MTGTFGGITPVIEVDGRMIAKGIIPGPVTLRLRELYRIAIERDVGVNR